MKILVTGAAGFLGSHLCDRLLQDAHEVVGVDNMIGGDEININPAVVFHKIDCCDFESMKSVMEGVDIVVHAAATAHEGLSVFSPDTITRNIFQASVATISAAIASNVKRFVFCSSMARYGNQPAPFTEDMETKPVDPYGIAKAAAEDILKCLCSVHGMEWNIVVPHNIIGPRQKYDDPFRNVLSIMLNRSFQDLPIYIYGDGQQVRCFSYVDECIECILPMMFGDITSEIVNIGPDKGEVSINELAALVLNETGSNLDPIHLADRPQEVKHATCSSEKARQLLGYEQKMKLQDAIRLTADWIRQNGTKSFDYLYPLEIINEKTPITWSERKM